MNDTKWHLVEGDGPIIAVANHDGHELRDELAALMLLSEEDRLREEDPHTGDWTRIAPTQIIAKHSRFEIDLNRSRDQAVYCTPEDAWGLNLWKDPLEDQVIARSLQVYDDYYSELFRICSSKEKQYGKFVILDLHSYNHRRNGPDGPAADQETNPEVNLGTGTMDRSKWSSLVDRFMTDLKAFDFNGRSLDVRENIKFVGRGLPSWTHTTFPDSGCALAIEFKKFFMDEWTGKVDRRLHNGILHALESTIPGLLEELRKVGARI